MVCDSGHILAVKMTPFLEFHFTATSTRSKSVIRYRFKIIILLHILCIDFKLALKILIFSFWLGCVSAATVVFVYKFGSFHCIGLGN